MNLVKISRIKVLLNNMFSQHPRSRVSIMDGSKSAWQSNIGDDIARLPIVIHDLCNKLDDASRGVFPGDKEATPSILPKPATGKKNFPFPDNVAPVDG